jgi:hypothetical protein
MSAKVSSLLSAQLNRVLKDLSREMRRIRTRIALDPKYPFSAECTSDLAALLIADKALVSIQRKMTAAKQKMMSARQDKMAAAKKDKRTSVKVKRRKKRMSRIKS